MPHGLNPKDHRHPAPGQPARRRKRRASPVCWNRGAPCRIGGWTGIVPIQPDVLSAFVWSRERQQGHVARALDGDRQRPLMLRTGAHLAPRLDLAAFTDVAAKPGQVLVIDVLDVVDGEGRYFPAWGVTSASAPRTTTSAARPSASFFATGGSRSTTRAARSSLTLWSAEAGSAAGTVVALRARSAVVSILCVIRHGSWSFCKEAEC